MLTMKLPAGVFAILIMVSRLPAPGDARPTNCAIAEPILGAAVHEGYTQLRNGHDRQAEASFRKAVSLFSACPRQTHRDDEASARQELAAVLWHLGKHHAAYAQLRAIRNLNEISPLTAGVGSTSANAFAKGDYRRAYQLLRASLSDGSFIQLPVGLADSGAATAIREALNAGAAGRFELALAKANQALKVAPRSQAARFMAGVSSIAAAHPHRARALLFDALVGYDANPHGSRFTNFSVTAAYMLVALGDERSAR